MLVLTRRLGEKLRIGEDVTVTVLGIKGNQIRVGIDAPRNVSVNREEVYQRILKELKALNSNCWVKIPDPTVKIPARVVKFPARKLSLSNKR